MSFSRMSHEVPPGWIYGRDRASEGLQLFALSASYRRIQKAGRQMLIAVVQQAGVLTARNSAMMSELRFAG